MTPTKDLQFHPVHEESNIPEFDVFIVGSGPLGATYARCLVDAGFSVLMVEIGAQDTRVPAEHKKNEIVYQKDFDRFVKCNHPGENGQGALSVVSIPRSQTIVPNLGPAAWTAEDSDQMWITDGRNPHQGEHNNLGAESVTRCVGGMSTHWTCSTPEFLKGVERPVIFTDGPTDDAEWNLLYASARSLIGTSDTEFDQSIRHNVVRSALQMAYPDRGVKSLPLACHRLADGSPYVQWHAASNVYGDMFTNPDKLNKKGVKRGYFKLLTNTRCTRFVLDSSVTRGHKVGLVEVQDLLGARLASDSDDSPDIDFYIKAKAFVVAAGAIANPQILANSRFGATNDRMKHLIPNLATHISEQPMTFCQVALLQRLVDSVDDPMVVRPPWWLDAVKKHKDQFGKVDPLPIPFQDPEPQIVIPTSVKRPWHTQIQRDAFSYGELGPSLDPRLVVDFRCFGMQEGVPENKIVFHKDIKDAYGMPQPTFHYKPTPKRAHETQRMMADMTDMASKIGAYIPSESFLFAHGNILDITIESEPQFMTPGLALHLGGTTRLGLGQVEDYDKTVGNFDSQIWEFTNLFVAGNGTIPTPFGANPTLTSMCLAFRGAYKIAHSLLLKKAFSPAVKNGSILPTPASWLSWTTDREDPNFPEHKVVIPKEAF
ncbi:putative pyranose oxidase [Mycena crocata]|nr:putative pyranose oxidase [Mycena crocata]